MRRETIALAFVALMLAGCTFSAPASPPAGSGAVDLSQMWGVGAANNWQAVASIAVIMSAFFVSIAYMLGSLLQIPMLINWAKGELMQVFASALIIGGLIWLVSMITVLSASMAGATGIDCTFTDVADKYAREELEQAPCHINVAQQYLQIMYENLYEMSRDLLVTGTLLSAISNFNITFEMLIPPWTTATMVPFAGMNMIFETLFTSFEMLSKIMLLLKFQMYFLSFIWRALFPMLLVLGVIMRTFWFSRKLGGLLIAIAIGMFIAFPLFYTLSYYVLGGTSAGTYVVKIDPSEYMEFLSDEEIAAWEAGVIPDYTAAGDGEMGDIMHRINRIENKNWLGDVLAVAGTGAPTEDNLENNWVVGEDGVLENVAKLLIYATFVPFIAIISTIAFIKGLSPLLGGDIEIAGLTHLI